MYKQVMHVTLLTAVVVLALIATPAAAGLLTDPDIIGWWECNEGEGAIVSDSSANGNDGTIIDGDPVWVPGVYGSAVELTIPTLVEIPALNIELTEATFAGWMKPYGTQPSWASFFMTRGGGTHGFNVLNDFQLAYHWNDDPGSWGYRGGDYIVDNEWTFAALTVTPSAATFFVNGVQGSTNSITHAAATFGQPLYLGGDGSGSFDDRRMTGALDDMSFFGRALSPDEIMELMGGAGDPALASAPYPADGDIDIPLDVVLSWTAGEFASAANGHKVYFGDTFEDVNNGDPSTDRGTISDPFFDVTMLPFALDYNTTYYWRIDEANSVAGWDVGQTWSFTTEPYAYPIEGVVLTTNTVANADQDPNSIINGSGLNENDEHSTDGADMWSGSAPASETPWLEFEFPRTYKLDQMLVWNYNHSFEMFLGLSVKDATIEYSLDGVDWTLLEDVVLPQGPGVATYTAGATIDFGGVAAKYVRMTINSGYGTTPMVGLSEVRFTYIPAQAREPKPADGATNIAADAVLAWRAGRDAVSNDIYLGTDPNALSMAGNSAEASFNPGPLDLGATYYWQVNANDGTDTWVGDLWSFETEPYIEIDGFESYTDDIDAGQTIWQTWIDGLDDPTNGGAVVGYESSPFAELTTVRSGDQAMPFFYNNVGASFSEADRTFSPAMDWSVNAIKSLSLWFYGAAGNTGNLYVKINDVKVSYDGAADDIAALSWQAWNIDLSAVGTDLSNVSTLSIGVEGTGSGVVYIDDIRLYAQEGAAIAPVQPDDANLVLYYALDEGAGAVANDASGNGNNGTIIGNPIWVAGQSGSALQFAGLSDYIATDKPLLDSLPTFSIACWIQGDFSTASRMGLVGQNDCIEYGFSAANNLQLWSPNGGTINAAWPYTTDEWHHVATVGYGTVTTVYVDGRPVSSGGNVVQDNYGSSSYTVNIAGGGVFDATENWFAGLIDEIRIYQRPLSMGEVAGLAGRTAPLYGEIQP